MITANESTSHPIRRIRLGLIGTGLAMLMLGAVCILAPIWFTAPVEWIVGGAMCVSGATGAFHLLLGHLTSLGRWRCGQSERSQEASVKSASSAGSAERAPVWTLVLLQIGLGGAMLGWPQAIRPFLLLILLLAVAAEGCIVFWASLHFQSLTTKLWMWGAALLSVVVVVVAIYYWRSPDAHRLVGWLIGAKMLTIGFIFFRVGLSANETDLRQAYVGLSSFQDEPTVGSIYAVYYGPAFHCGISIGDGMIVDYLTDGIVRCITWEEFLLGRRAMEWNYLDVSAGSDVEISQFARSLVGKYTRYDGLKFNCENLAIYCRSVGATTYSNYSQAASGVELVRQKPLIGSLLQLLNRGASWFLYGAGGPFGKKIGFAMIRIARALTDWVVARPLRSAELVRVPKMIYMPQFEERKST